MADLRPLTRKQLRVLAATVERGSVSGAAHVLHVTPPAVSVQLKSLEELVGAPLFRRTADAPFAPTEIGQELLVMAQDLERLAARAGERIAALKAGASGSLVFGVVSTAKYLAPSIVAAFQRDCPGVRVTLAVGNRGEIVRGLERNEYDVTIMGRPPPHIEADSAILGDHPYILIAPPDHRLAGDSDILAEDLLQERFLAREEGSGTRVLMERFLERIGGGRSFEVIEMGTNETIKQSVMAGLGIAMISAHTCLTEIVDRHLVALPVPGLPLVRQWHLLHRSDRELSRAAQKFRDFVLERRATLLPKLGAIGL
ncbi:MAG TPA: LysR family transcriptional regulator [Rhodoblastus sp.]|nr:LysR family transcriptional regulator [Rhodoblastus sp.]